MFVCSPHVCVGFFRVLRFPPQSKTCIIRIPVSFLNQMHSGMSGSGAPRCCTVAAHHFSAEDGSRTESLLCLLLLLLLTSRNQAASGKVAFPRWRGHLILGCCLFFPLVDPCSRLPAAASLQLDPLLMEIEMLLM